MQFAKHVTNLRRLMEDNLMDKFVIKLFRQQPSENDNKTNLVSKIYKERKKEK